MSIKHTGKKMKYTIIYFLFVSLLPACSPPPQPPKTEENGLLRVLDDRFPLIKAASEGRTEEVEKLLKISAFKKDIDGQHDKDGSTALIHSAEKGHVEIMDLLLKAGADPNLPDFKGRSPLIHSASRGKKNAVEKLLSVEGLEVNAEDKYGRTAFTHAAKNGHVEIMDLLLKASADPFHKSFKGQTPLMYSARAGKTNAVKKLLQINSTHQINTRDNGRGLTALIQAVKRGHDEIVDLLLKAGADPNLSDFKGRSPLMYSAMKGKPSVVKRLLQIESVRKNINSQDKNGNTAFLLAEEEGYTEITALLREAGADPQLGKGALLNMKKLFKKLFFRDKAEEEDSFRITAGGGSFSSNEEKSFWEKTKLFFKNLFSGSRPKPLK